MAKQSDEKASEGKANAVVIPMDTINEQIVVAAALVDEQVRTGYLMQTAPDVFVDADHGLIWDGMRQVMQRGKGFDLQLLHAQISGKVRLEYLQQLMQRYPVAPVNLQQHL